MILQVKGAGGWTRMEKWRWEHGRFQRLYNLIKQKCQGWDVIWFVQSGGCWGLGLQEQGGADIFPAM